MARKSRKKKKKITDGDINQFDLNPYLKDSHIDIMLMNHGIEKLIKDHAPTLDKFIEFFEDGMKHASDYICKKILEKHECGCTQDLLNKIENDLRMRLKTLYDKFK